ncbi:MAG: AAA family ATPase [Clostridium sp.]
MGKVICIFNQKGGVGKTTTTINLCAYLASSGKRILIIDIDPQGNTSSGLSIDKENLEYSMYHVIMGISAKKAIIHTEVENLDIIPGTVELAGAEIELTAQISRETKLKDALDTVKEDYDYIFIDCPPSLGLLTINSLTASNSVLIPIQCEFYALEGVGQLMKTIQLVKRSLNKDLEVQGVVMSMFDGRTNLSIEVVEEVKKFFKSKVYSTIIPRNVKLAEAPSHGKPIMLYDKMSRGAKAYEELAAEFLEYDEEDN